MGTHVGGEVLTVEEDWEDAVVLGAFGECSELFLTSLGVPKLTFCSPGSVSSEGAFIVIAILCEALV